MGNRLIKRFLWGFVFGAVSGILISGFLNLLSGNGFSIVARELLLEKGKTAAVIMQVLFSGIYGAICIGGTIFYEIERIGLFFTLFKRIFTIIPVELNFKFKVDLSALCFVERFFSLF